MPLDHTPHSAAGIPRAIHMSPRPSLLRWKRVARLGLVALGVSVPMAQARALWLEETLVIPRLEPGVVYARSSSFHVFNGFWLCPGWTISHVHSVPGPEPDERMEVHVALFGVLVGCGGFKGGDCPPPGACRVRRQR